MDLGSAGDKSSGRLTGTCNLSRSPALLVSPGHCSFARRRNRCEGYGHYKRLQEAILKAQLYKTNGEINMGQNNGISKRSEKGLLTPDNCVVALIDHQPQMLFGTSNFDRQAIINTTVALGKAARVFDVPVVLTTVETRSFSGNLCPQIRSVFPGQAPMERSSMNSWGDKNFVA